MAVIGRETTTVSVNWTCKSRGKTFPNQVFFCSAKSRHLVLKPPAMFSLWMRYTYSRNDQDDLRPGGAKQVRFDGPTLGAFMTEQIEACFGANSTGIYNYIHCR